MPPEENAAKTKKHSENEKRRETIQWGTEAQAAPIDTKNCKGKTTDT